MKTSEYIEKYPEMRIVYEQGTVESVGKSRKRVCDIKCSICGKDYRLQWNHIQSRYQDGKPVCANCAPKRASESKKLNPHYQEIQRNWRNAGNTPEARRKANKKRASWYYGSEEEQRAIAAAWKTKQEKGTAWRSGMELDIEKRFGGQHSAPEFRYELDCYWPELKKGVEVDDPTHDEGGHKPVGYHKAKDRYFEELGIEVLHLTFHHGDWEARVANFLDGVYEGPLIDLDDETYGDIVYD